jgi:predicted O-methyltransferase YrrM
MSAHSVRPTLEEVADFALQILKTAGIVHPDAPEPDWDYFVGVQRKIERFEVPWTTITSAMRRFFYALSATAGPERMVGAGTYAGFGFAYLTMGHARGQGSPTLVEAVGLDIDAEATALARRNATLLDLGEQLRFEQAEAITWLRDCRTPISLLYIDIDVPSHRKSGYIDVLEAARPKLTPGALIVAHDACVPLFASDFERFHAAIKQDSGLIGPQVLPLDECGVSVCRVAASC